MFKNESNSNQSESDSGSTSNHDQLDVESNLSNEQQQLNADLQQSSVAVIDTCKSIDSTTSSVLNKSENKLR